MHVMRTIGVLAAIGFMACAGKSPEPSAADQQAGDSSGIQVTGVVKRVEVSGGCWQFLADDSTHYELRAGQAPETLLVDQKRATLTLKRRPDLMSTCMVGQIVDVQQ